LMLKNAIVKTRTYLDIKRQVSYMNKTSAIDEKSHNTGCLGK
jgi:hypothetical protein